MLGTLGGYPMPFFHLFYVVAVFYKMIERDVFRVREIARNQNVGDSADNSFCLSRRNGRDYIYNEQSDFLFRFLPPLAYAAFCHN